MYVHIIDKTKLSIIILNKKKIVYPSIKVNKDHYSREREREREE